MFSLYTDTPEFYNDICEEIRLFVNEKKIALVNKDEIGAGHCLRHFFWCDETGWNGKVEYCIDGEINQKTVMKPDLQSE